MSVKRTLSRARAVIKDGTSSFVFHLLFAALVTVVVFLHSPSIFSGDTDTARNYLNTIVSSLSTILALCISIILVAIQMTAGNYTHRVLDFYVRLPYNVSLFFFYLATIIHSLFLMARIRDPLNDPLPTDLSSEMSADLVLVVICFLSTLLYMYAVVQLLKPERIIQLIDREYNRALARGRLQAALNSVEQICDIAKRAASFSDSITGMYCLSVMSRIAASLPLPTSEEDPLLSMHSNIVDQWVEIVGVAVKERDTGVLTGVLNALFQQGMVYVEGESWRGAELVIRSYRHLASGHLLAEGHVYYIEGVASRLYELASVAAAKGDRGRAFAQRTWRVASDIGRATVLTSPASAFTTSQGFLMSQTFRETLDSFPDVRERMVVLAAYFDLWKVFVQHMSKSDVARWGVWWNSALSPHRLTQEVGKELAFCLTVHLGLPVVSRTLTHVWDTEPVGLRRESLSLLEPFSQALFDGWPIPAVGKGQP